MALADTDRTLDETHPRDRRRPRREPGCDTGAAVATCSTDMVSGSRRDEGGRCDRRANGGLRSACLVYRRESCTVWSAFVFTVRMCDATNTLTSSQPPTDTRQSESETMPSPASGRPTSHRPRAAENRPPLGTRPSPPQGGGGGARGTRPDVPGAPDQPLRPAQPHPPPTRAYPNMPLCPNLS
jgi:hypothetical protein